MNPRQKPKLKYRFYPSGDRNDFSSQTQNQLDCIICDGHFNDIYDLYSHILTQCHKNSTYFTCLSCKFKLNKLTPESHDCFRNKSTYIQHLSKTSIKHGLPTICLLCRGRKFQSKVQLFVHLICYHSQSNDFIKKCGLCSYRIKTTKKLKKSTELNQLPTYNKEFDQHINETHIFGYAMNFINQLMLDSSKRQPYACIVCPAILKSNDQFHAHIISRHALKNEYESCSYVCFSCKTPFWTEENFIYHVNSLHAVQFKKVAINLSKLGLIDNYIDLEMTCIFCWCHFENRIILQIHLLMFHCYYSTSITCGLCSLEIKTNKDLKTVYNNYLQHQNDHFQHLSSGKRMRSENYFTIPLVSNHDVSNNYTLFPKIN